MVPRAAHHGDFRGGVRLVGFVVEVDPDELDQDAFGEMDVDGVRLGAVGLPEEAGVLAAQLGDPAAGFGGRDGPGGEVADFFEVGEGVRGGGGGGGGGEEGVVCAGKGC